MACIVSPRSRVETTSLTHSIVLPQRSEFSMTRDLNYSNLTLAVPFANSCYRFFWVVSRVSIYSWSVHLIRRMRTHSVTVTVRSSHSTRPVLVHLSDSLPVSSACKESCYENQSRRLKNEGEKIFPHFTLPDRHYTHL